MNNMSREKVIEVFRECVHAIEELDETIELAPLLNYAQSAIAALEAEQEPVGKLLAEPVYCVPTDKVSEDGKHVLYSHHDTPVPMADNVVLFTAPPAQADAAKRIEDLENELAIAKQQLEVLPHLLGGAPAESEDCAAYREASTLAMSLWCQHYKDQSPSFKLCDTTAGIITQIDNMAAGLAEKAAAVPDAKSIAKELTNRLFMQCKSPEIKRIQLMSGDWQKGERGEGGFCKSAFESWLSRNLAELQAPTPVEKAKPVGYAEWCNCGKCGAEMGYVVAPDIEYQGTLACYPMDATPAAHVNGAKAPDWEPCNPACDPEFGGYRTASCPVSSGLLTGVMSDGRHGR